MKKFYPASTGLTKADVLACLRDAIKNGEYGNIRMPDQKKLTDKVMQKFINEKHLAYMDGLGEMGDGQGREEASEAEDAVFQKLAKKIQGAK